MLSLAVGGLIGVDRRVMIDVARRHDDASLLVDDREASATNCFVEFEGAQFELRFAALRAGGELPSVVDIPFSWRAQSGSNFVCMVPSLRCNVLK